MRRGKAVGTGLLAADLDYDAASGIWQIRKIYGGDFPDPKVSSPLARPDLRVKPGQWLQQFARDYPPQWRKRGLVMDDRWNHGGFVAPMILAHLDRKILAIGGTRHGGPVDTTPSRAFHGYMMTLINRQGGSDCETFAQGFKDFKLGPVVGTRTWGGWVGIRGDKPLRDGGSITQPEFGGWDPKG